MVDEGVEAVSMEVSAHAVDMHRVDGITFEAACYTNFSQDHLDYFGTMEKYFETKKRFFIEGSALNAARNADDETSASIIRDLKVPYLTYGISAEADVFARDIEISEEGVSFSIRLRGLEDMSISMHLTGMFNVYNALCAITACSVLNIPVTAMQQGLKTVKVKGRVEPVPMPGDFTLLIDYAHNAVSMQSILTTLRAYHPKRLICMFGAGGNRPKVRRFEMGEVSGKLAALSVITADNSRYENVLDILADIKVGLAKTDGKYIEIPDRREAIRWCIENAQPGDIIVLAGKGHEDYQEIECKKYPFDERVVIREILDSMK